MAEFLFDHPFSHFEICESTKNPFLIASMPLELLRPISVVPHQLRLANHV